jgi:hypothetical protein
LLDLIQEKEFEEVCLCFFEPYHGKSEVDSMFGTYWLNEWVKTRYLNTTDDVLQCFEANNPGMHFLLKTFFGKFLLHLKYRPNRASRLSKTFSSSNINFLNFLLNLEITFRLLDMLLNQ